MIQSLLSNDFPTLDRYFCARYLKDLITIIFNTKVCLFNELLVERFLDTEDFLTVVDTVQPEIKFYYEDGLHLSNLGISKLCGIILSRLYKILAPTSHKSRVSARQNRKAFARGSSSFKQYSRSNSK